jgi:hypothetical protein
MPSMKQEQFFWISDLTVRAIDVDPSLKLPLICAAIQFLNQGVRERERERESVCVCVCF